MTGWKLITMRNRFFLISLPLEFLFPTAIYSACLTHTYTLTHADTPTPHARTHWVANVPLNVRDWSESKTGSATHRHELTINDTFDHSPTRSAIHCYARPLTDTLRDSLTCPATTRLVQHVVESGVQGRNKRPGRNSDSHTRYLREKGCKLYRAGRECWHWLMR